MKKINLYRVVNIVLIVSFAIINYLYYQLKVFDFYIDNFWFVLFLFTVGLSMFFKSALFKSDSSLWLSIVLLLCGVAVIMFSNAIIGFSKFWPLAIVIPSFASVVVGVRFKNIFHIKSALFLFIVCVPVICLSFSIINIWWYIALQLVSLWIAIIMFRIMPEKWFGKK